MQSETLIKTGSREYNKANLALFLAGFVTFVTLYDFQPLFPSLVDEYNISPATASLTLSCATFSLACTLPLSGSLSDAVGRKILMSIAVVCAPALTLASTMINSLHILLLMRLGQGIILAGVPAVAMAYLRDEFEPRALGSTMGLYIAGNAIGGMSGRIFTAWLTDIMSWRWALVMLSLLCLLCGIFFWVLLPASRNFRSQPFQLSSLTGSLLNHVCNPGLLYLFLIAFACMGGFVTLYNYITFRLLGDDFALTQSQAGLIFLAYAFGAFSSRIMGSLVNRYGRSHILLTSLSIMAGGLILTLGVSLWMVASGIVVFTIGFFGAHSVASAWVGIQAGQARAQASSLYLFSYYLGSSVSGTAGGFFYHHWNWVGIVILIVGLILMASMACLLLARVSRDYVV
ncbi:MAG: MFS transporter [Desulfobulbus propionicus]|nr:MAG: MFS transporter [Desulfobulbus propionicus]